MCSLLMISSFIALAVAISPELSPRGSVLDVCKQIAGSISSASDVFFPLEFQYNNDIAHWASSSTQNAVCSIEPGTAEDVGVILQILGETQTPFAVKGGGHASNPGFSSTTGIQIAMSRFSDVSYNATSQTVTFGSGLIWDDVYAALEPLGVNVVGGRVTGVGVAGFTLGGGYSWKTNQFGLTIDTVEAFELVLPNGTVTNVTSSSNPDLFFALKGGFNNYGVVTKFTVNAFPQTQVWGGLITFTQDYLEAVNNATLKFATEVTDPKASIITTYNFLLGEAGVSQLLFYDGPTPPSGIFDDFLAIQSFTSDVSTRSFLSLVQASPSNATSGTRAIFHTVSLLEYSASMLDAVLNETTFWGERLGLDSATFISYDVEPFLPSVFSHGSDSAYPPDRSRGLLPLNIYFAWTLPTSDDIMQDAALQSASFLTQKAVAGGQDITDAALYGNYAIFSTQLSQIYGSNLARLQTIKAQYDPQNVMGLAGGWKL
ncbi:FAD-binding domain-containing protein [Obba rivulosa]|uniref:FAD-binding domain-containing protein n=1 Tax=Obba rivulosa TaxID=1052685 RepID=A0A8E2DML8_9APHY|nr:FAD-binding domain-containing protein [Obba rivulosa]